MDLNAQHLKAARQAVKKGQLVECASYIDKVLASEPENSEACFLKGIVLVEARQHKKALVFLRDAVQKSPKNAEYNAHLSRILLMLREEGEAENYARIAAQNVKDDALTLDTIGCVFARLGDHEAAQKVFEKAVALNPNNVDFRFNLVATYGFFGKTEEAGYQYEEILKRNPCHGKSHLGLAALKRQTPNSNHIKQIEAAIASVVDPIEKLRIHYAAAKEYEDLSEFEKAFNHLNTANTLHTQRLKFDVETDEKNANVIKQCFADKAYLSTQARHEDTPVFIVGMPRTGTSLVDRILSAHPDANSLGELQSMPIAVKRASQTTSRLILDRDTILQAGKANAHDIGALYLKHSKQFSGAKGNAVLVDKLPMNFLYAGFIAKALPKARIVCLRRHPMDTVWSNYKNLFATTSSYYGYSYDLMNTARYYVIFDRLMGFWQEKYPDQILQLDYQELTGNQESETRKLLAFCGLSWAEECLNFHQQTQAMATPSALQVREPIHQKSVGKWRAYEDQLQEVISYLSVNGISI
ncbi:tetratricopeptide repeat-containing sulfotransferase family protein [Hirschia baltica]|uniref:Tetratricopeptide TPR_2 repeat protein n=1 Tax=Hirschia baltica (strain ATCC 49814 / DSM 5838 / IFAM 1418) TaxID=582402 RepID=C6XQ89_HIRBI|nr:tetratricopeptide repeat-containing sulfotransferase family protein [Hirschia baltica]ACT60388.1 Tetratricopeptide TPR_2 repeat protein [Hirschia baltica ATCC 49814]